MASFFYFLGVADQEDEIIDTLAARYGWSVPDILGLDIPRLWRTYNRATRERQRDRVRAQWLTLLPYMSMEMLQFMSFEDYFDQVTGANIDLRPAKDILAEVEEVRRELNGAI